MPGNALSLNWLEMENNSIYIQSNQLYSSSDFGFAKSNQQQKTDLSLLERLSAKNHLEPSIYYYKKVGEMATIPICRMKNYFRTAWLLMHQSSFGMAAEMFKRVIDTGMATYNRKEPFEYALYWYGFCKEAKGEYLAAIEYYRSMNKISALYHPESRYREISCLTQIGLFQEAWMLCHVFEALAPIGFDKERYGQLKEKAFQEGEALISYFEVA